MLKDYICVSERHKIDTADASIGKGVTTRVTGAVPWRPEGIKHKKNEVFLDVVEKLNLLVSQTGYLIYCFIFFVCFFLCVYAHNHTSKTRKKSNKMNLFVYCRDCFTF